MLGQLVFIFVAGAVCQWVSWRLKIPAILTLLLSGLVAGPIIGFLQPKELFSSLLFPIVSLSVALILYEGGLDLRFKDIKGKSVTILSLVTIGTFINWCLISLASLYILNLNLELSMLIGGILTVSGPTVVQPLLSYIKPREPSYSILKWEGILIDPIGAVLAVLILEEILIAKTSQHTLAIAIDLAGTLIVGCMLGYCFGKLFIYLTKIWSFPEELYNTISIACLFAAFYISNLAFHEAGLVAVTIMGIVVGNKGSSSIKEVIAFKENLRVLLISSLFIVLAANVNLALLQQVSFKEVLFIAFIIVIARPASVYLATAFQGLKLNDRLFIASMYPRGIVAAAVASLFAIKLEQAGMDGSEQLTTIVFIVIVSTVTIYALSGSTIARILKVKTSAPTTVLLVGINKFSIALAEVFKREGLDILIVDTNTSKVMSSRLAGLPTVNTNLLSNNSSSEIDLVKIGYSLSLTSNHEANSLISLKMQEVLGKGRGLQSPPSNLEAVKESIEADLRGNFFPGSEYNLDNLLEKIAAGYEIKLVNITTEFSMADLKLIYEDLILLFRFRENKPTPFSDSYQPEILPGDKVVFLGKSI